MTLDEEIKNAEEVVDANERLSETIHPAMQLVDYGKIAERHRQLAEWLKELKWLREQEPCEDCISRQAALDAFGLSEKTRKYGGDHSGYDTLMKYEIQDVLEDLPSVTPQQKMGRWISFGTQGEIDGQIVRAFTCSECGAISVFRMTDGKIVNGDSCANCRAKMEEAEE